MMKTYMAKPGEVEQKWWLMDATDQVVGRMASQIAVILMGKHRPTYTPARRHRRLYRGDQRGEDHVHRTEMG